MRLTVLPPSLHILSESFFLSLRLMVPMMAPVCSFHPKQPCSWRPPYFKASLPVHWTKSITMCGQATALHLHLSNARIPRRVRWRKIHCCNMNCRKLLFVAIPIQCEQQQRGGQRGNVVQRKQSRPDQRALFSTGQSKLFSVSIVNHRGHGVLIKLAARAWIGADCALFVCNT